VGEGDQMKLIKITKEAFDLKRYLKVQYHSQYLYDRSSGSIMKLGNIPSEAGSNLLLVQCQSPWSGALQIRVRRGEKNEKDLFIELWRDYLLQSRKISDKCTKVYNEVIFGGMSWARDESKVVFIGEKSEPASYKNYWEDSQPPKEEKPEEEKKKADDQKDEHWMDEKYQFVDDFGETMVGKKRPTIFIYDLKENQFYEVVGLNPTLYPASPKFDEKS